MARRFVALDRDGTIIVERHYLSDPEQVALLPGAATGLRALRARGFFDQARLEAIHQRLGALLQAQGVRLDGLYVCPHRPDEGCACRKPGTGLLERAASELRFDPRSSFVIGDKACDVELGQRVGATTLLVRTGYGAQTLATLSSAPDYVADDLQHAAALIRATLAGGTIHAAAC
jgi:HAD superfamily hydrolase (TIGR01662 family)